MATIYFTSTAATGDGTFRNAVLNAQSGDVISPDPSVFPIGSTVEVEMAAALNPPVNVTVDAGKTRLVIAYPSGIVVQTRPADGVDSFNARGVTFIGRVIIGASSELPSTATFNKCVFGSGTASTYLFQATAGNATLEFNDCLFTGSLTYPIYLSGSNLTAALNRCTIAGNATDTVYGNAASSATLTDCVVPSDLSTEYVQFANAPSDVSGYSTSNLPPWRSWNWAPLSTSTDYASGASTLGDGFDLLGNSRGWYNNGVLTYAKGAIEVVVADYFQGTNADFNVAGSWYTDRGLKTAASTLAAGTFYISNSATFNAAPPQNSTLYLQGTTSFTVGTAANYGAISTNLNNEVRILADNNAPTTIGLDIGPVLSLVNKAGEKTNAALILSQFSVKTVNKTIVDNPGLISLPASFVTPSELFTDASRIIPRGATITSFNVEINGSTVTPVTTTSADDGDILYDYRVYNGTSTAYTTLGKESATLSPLTTAKSVAVRAFDGERFFVQTCPRVYYYVGGESGSFATASDWSLTNNGDALTETPTVENCSFIIP